MTDVEVRERQATASEGILCFRALESLTCSQVVQLGRNSLAHAFAPPAVKTKLLADYETRIAAFEKKYGSDSLTVTDALAKLAAVKPVTYGYAKRTWGLEFHPRPAP